MMVIYTLECIVLEQFALKSHIYGFGHMLIQIHDTTAPANINLVLEEKKCHLKWELTNLDKSINFQCDFISFTFLLVSL